MADLQTPGGPVIPWEICYSITTAEANGVCIY